MPFKNDATPKETVQSIRRARSRGLTCGEIALKLKMNLGTVTKIATGQRRKNVKDGEGE